MLSEEFAVDLGRCLRWQKADRLLFVSSNWCIPVKNILGWNSIVFCLCVFKIMQSFYLAFCLVRAVRKFGFRLFATYKMATRWKKTIHYKRLMFLKYLYIFLRPLSSALRDCTLAVRSTAFSWVSDLVLTSPINVDFTYRPSYPRQRTQVHIEWEAGWAP